MVCDIRDGLPLESDSVDYAVSIHALVEVPYEGLDATLQELRRVLKPQGVLRLGLPDFERFIQAFIDGDREYFLIPDGRVRSLGGKLIAQSIWFGHIRTPLIFDFTEELLLEAGFTSVTRCRFKQTPSGFPEIVELDDREDLSFFVEAVK